MVENGFSLSNCVPLSVLPVVGLFVKCHQLCNSKYCDLNDGNFFNFLLIKSYKK